MPTRPVSTRPAAPRALPLVRALQRATVGQPLRLLRARRAAPRLARARRRCRRRAAGAGAGRCADSRPGHRALRAQRRAGSGRRPAGGAGSGSRTTTPGSRRRGALARARARGRAGAACSRRCSGGCAPGGCCWRACRTSPPCRRASAARAGFTSTRRGTACTSLRAASRRCWRAPASSTCATDHVVWEHNPAGMWMALLARAGMRPGLPFHLLKRNATARPRDWALLAAGVPLAPARLRWRSRRGPRGTGGRGRGGGAAVGAHDAPYERSVASCRTRR